MSKPVSSSVASFGVNQIIKTEKNAAQKIEEARQRRILRLKQAEFEAKEEVTKLRKEREAQFDAFKNKAISVNKYAELRVENAARKAISELDKQANENKAKVIQDILQLVCDVKPEIHPNYLLSRNKTRKIVPPVDAFVFNVRPSVSSAKTPVQPLDQYEERESIKDSESLSKKHASANANLCNICKSDTRIDDGRVCTVCNPNASFHSPEDVSNWICPGVLCEGGSPPEETNIVLRAEATYNRTPFQDVVSLISEKTEDSNTVDLGDITNSMKLETDENVDKSVNYYQTNHLNITDYHKSSHSEKLMKSAAIDYYESSDYVMKWETDRHANESNNFYQTTNFNTTDYHESSQAESLTKSETGGYASENEIHYQTDHFNSADYHESSHGDKQNVQNFQESLNEKDPKEESCIENENRNHVYPTLDLSESNPKENTTIIIEIPRIGDNFHPSLPWRQTHCRKCSRYTRNIKINLNSVEANDSSKKNSTKEVSQTVDCTATVIGREFDVPRSLDVTSQKTTLSTTPFNTNIKEEDDNLCEPEF